MNSQHAKYFRLYRVFLSWIEPRIVLRSAMTGALVIIALFLGMLSGPLYTYALTDYGLAIAIVFWLGTFFYLPLAALFYYVVLLFRKRYEAVKLATWDHVFLAFGAMLAYYPIFAVSDQVLHFTSRAASLFVLLLSPLPIFVLSLALMHYVHFYLRNMQKGNMRAPTILLGTLFVVFLAGVAIFAPPSARDICDGLHKGEAESIVASRLRSFERLISMEEYNSERRQYNFNNARGEYFITSPGLYCTVSVLNGVVVSVFQGIDAP